MDKQTLRRADLIMSTILLAFSVFVFILSAKLMNRTLNLNNPDSAIWYRSAGLIPMIVSVLLAISSIALFARARKEGAKFDFFKKEKFKNFFLSREFRIAGFIIGWLAVYIFVLLGPVEKVIYEVLYSINGISWIVPYYLPYILMTFIYLFVFIIAFNDRKIKKNWIISSVISLVVSVLVAYLFGNVAMIILP